MAWDFTADSDLQRTLAKRITEGADKFHEDVENTYKEIANMEQYWDGTDHDAYVTGTEGYRTALTDLENSIRMFSYQFEKVLAPATEDLAKVCYNLIFNLTATPATAAASGGDDGAGNSGTPDGGTPDGGQDAGQDGGQDAGQNGTPAGGGETLPDNGTQDSGNPGNDGNNYGAPLPGEQPNDGGNSGTPGEQEQPTPVPTPTPEEANSYAAVQDPNAETETLSAEQPAEEQNPGWWEKVTGRYVDDWNGFTSDVADTWSDANGLLSGLGSLAVTANEWFLFSTDTGLDTVEAVVDTIDVGANWLFDLGTGRGAGTSEDYWDHIGEDYAENWDYSNVDGFWEGAGVTVGGVVRTVADAGQTVVNAADTAIDWVCDRGSDILDGIGDAGSTLIDWIF